MSVYETGGASSLRTRPLKNRKGGSGTSAGVEVYTAPGMKAHFRLAFDYHSDVHLLEMLTAMTVFAFCFVLVSCKRQAGKIERVYWCLVQQKTLQTLQGSAINKIPYIPQCTLPPWPMVLTLRSFYGDLHERSDILTY